MKKMPALLVIGILIAIALAILGMGSQVGRGGVNCSVSESDVVESLNAFAFKIFSRLNYGRENTLISPFNIHSALTMAYEGARGETASEMASVLCLPNCSPAEGYKSLCSSLKSANSLSFANGIWVQESFPMREDYVMRIADYYGGTAESLNFAGDPEGARERINSYIKERTSGRIEELLPSGSLDPLTRLVITNAVHFKGTWRYRFDPESTFEGQFRAPKGVVKAQMMKLEPEVRLNYTDSCTHEVLELPHDGRFSMLIFLPKEGAELKLTLDEFEKALESMREVEFDEVIMPKFELSSEYNLNDALIRLGMMKAFDGNEADFTGIYEREKVGESLHISLVRHKSCIKVDEEGTEAAGATGVVMKLTAAREKIFAADHPFLFIILDRGSGAILFIGSLVDPTAK